MKKTVTSLAAAVLLAATSPIDMAQTAGGPLSMQEAIETARLANPEILQAQYKTEAIPFEREQAQSLFLRRVDVEASEGISRLENNTRHELGISEIGRANV